MNNELLRLLNNIRMLVEVGALDEEFEAFAEDENIETIEDLNEVIETKILYMVEDSDNE